MHPRNKHQDRYDLSKLSQDFPLLAKALIKTKYGEESIDFSNAESVKVLNQALLKSYYAIDWDIPQKFLCPPIPGRSDYIHHIADLVGLNKKNVRVLDIGVGANCIYPIIGVCEYDWQFVGSDINAEALKAAQSIVNKNQKLNGKIELRLQKTKGIFKALIDLDEKFDVTICNPPFHISAEAAAEGTIRKWKNLGKTKKAGDLNFGGTNSELWTEGGEKAFIKQMIEESIVFKNQSQWFTTLVSKEENLPYLEQALKKIPNCKYQVIDLSQGQKKSRILCWTIPQ